MTWARGSLIVLLAAIAAGALTLSASSTLQLASRSGVHNVQFSSIAVLELAAIVGTVMWLRASHWRSRVEAALLVVGASAVTAVGGLGAYGLFGLVGPAFLVASVHVASREWRAEPSVETDTPDELMSVNEPKADTPTEPWGAPETVPSIEHRAPKLHAVDDLSKLTLPQLRDLARAEGARVRGSKAEVAAGIRANRTEQEASA
jgi:hypothetical protein